MNTDAWLNAARTLRTTALAHNAVARLVEKTPYETRGRGAIVRGIALRDDGHAVTAQTGLFLDLSHVLDGSIEVVAQDLRASMIRQWEQLETGREITIHLDVVDLVAV